MDQLIGDCITGKSVIIWGARIVGLGLSRKCLKDGHEILGFIDSDNALTGRYINGFRVDQPSNLSNILNQNKAKKNRDYNSSIDKRKRNKVDPSKGIAKQLRS